MSVTTSGLPPEHVSTEDVRAAHTLPTNVELYVWCPLTARYLDLLNHWEAYDHIAQALESTTVLERHEDSVQFFNWHDSTTGELLSVFPQTGNPIFTFLHNVDTTPGDDRGVDRECTGA